MSGSKAYKGKTCAYCATPESSTEGDHVVARGFFPPAKRGDLPIVPACTDCNNAKSKLEHYLAAVMPFGGQHTDAPTILAMVEGRLAKNLSLAARLAQTFRHMLTSRNGSPWALAATVEVDAGKLVNLYEYIARGLAFHHWGVTLPADDCIVGAAFLRSPGSEMIEALLAKPAAQRVSCDLGEGAFLYEGAQAVDYPQITVWRMTLYGAELGGDPCAPGVKVSSSYVITAPKQVQAACALIAALQGLK